MERTKPVINHLAQQFTLPDRYRRSLLFAIINQIIEYAHGTITNAKGLISVAVPESSGNIQNGIGENHGEINLRTKVNLCRLIGIHRINMSIIKRPGVGKLYFGMKFLFLPCKYE